MANLACLWNFPSDLAKLTISKNALSCVWHGKTRKTRRGAIKMFKVNDSDSDTDNSGDNNDHIM